MDKTKRIINNDITELYNEGTTIYNIEDFFNYYDNVKEDINRLESNESHQYLVDEAIKITSGDILIYKGISYNNLSDCYEQLGKEKLKNISLESEISSLNEVIKQLLNTMNNSTSSSGEISGSETSGSWGPNIPEGPTLLTPPNNSQQTDLQNILFSWDYPLQDDEKYTLQIYEIGESSDTLVVELTDLDVNELYIDEYSSFIFKNETSYYWKVKVTETKYSDVYFFTTKEEIVENQSSDNLDGDEDGGPS